MVNGKKAGGQSMEGTQGSEFPKGRREVKWRGKGAIVPCESPVVVHSPMHLLPLGKELTPLMLFPKNRMFAFLLETQGALLLQNFNLLAFLFHKVKFLLRFFLTRAKILKRWSE